MKDELRRADGTIADLRSGLEEERNYISRLRKERDVAKEKLEDALAAVDTARRDLAEMQASHVGAEAHYKRKISDLENAVADALRKKNRERLARNIAVKKKVTMDLQRETERSLKTLLEKCDVTFAASGVKFDAEASSSEDEGGLPPEPHISSRGARVCCHRGGRGATCSQCTEDIRNRSDNRSTVCSR